MENEFLRNQIPEDWKSLRVAEFVRNGSSFPSNLFIYRRKASPNIYSKWLPLEKEDWRENKGRSKSGKRLPIEASLETEDAKDALKEAIKWVKKLEKKVDGIPTDNDYSLHKYWEGWFARACQKEQRNVQAQRKFVRDTKLKWEADEWGVKHQAWSLKCVEDIVFTDFADYFLLLENRAKKNNGTNGSGMKEQQKAFIRALMKEARIDFPHLQIPDFPSVSRQTKQVAHLNQQQWELLLREIKKLADGAVNKALTYKEYKALEWTPHRRENQRNWVDLYDALYLEWFFYLRAEDMPRLKSEWFQDNGEGVYQCLLEETKGHRDIHITESFRPDADRFMREMKSRRPKKGYLIFPEIPRPDEGGAENKVRNTLNFLLRKAVEKCLPDFDLGNKPWTTIRHTAFRLTLEQDSSLWLGHKLRDFARNGHTSSDQLLTTYITPIQSVQTAKETRENLRSKGWKSGSRLRV